MLAADSPQQQLLVLTDCSVDLARHRLLRGADVASLTTKEAELLAYLAARPGRDVERDDLLRDVWGYRSHNPTRAVDFTVKRLRAKVEPDPANPVHVISVRGVGYRFVPGPSLPDPASIDAASPSPSLLGAQPPRQDAPAAPPLHGPPQLEPSPTPAPAPAPPRLSPSQAARFVGRRDELAKLHALLAQPGQPIVLHGLGGAGKTRLAHQFALAVQAQATHSVWLCELSEALTPDDALRTLARTLGCPIGGQLSTDALTSHLAAHLNTLGPTLLVLDNLEQLLALRGPLAALIAACPALQLLLTSRERLGLPGELLFAVQPLPDADAAELFTDRAQSLLGAQGPALDPAVVLQLVTALDGLPLAIELAASRLRAMSAPQLLQHMSARFKLVRDPRASLPERHQSLRAVLDASWEVLPELEREALASLSAFRGSFTMEAAEEVLDLVARPDAPWIVDLLQALRERSLLQATSGLEGANDLRYRLLETVRDYATERLAERHDAAEVRARHARYYADEGERLGKAARGAGGEVMLDRLAAEQPNLLAAHAQVTDPALRLRLALALRPLLLARGPASLGEALLKTSATDARGAPPELAAPAWTALALAYVVIDPERARDYLDAAEACAAEVASPALRGAALMVRAELALRAHDLHESEMAAREAADLFTRAAETGLMGQSLAVLALILLRRGAQEAAERSLQRGLRMLRRSGDAWSVAVGVGQLGALAERAGRAEEADTHAEEAAALLERHGDRRELGLLWRRHALATFQRGAYPQCERALNHADAAFHALGERRYAPALNIARADLWLSTGRDAEAEALLISAIDEARAQDDRRRVALGLETLARTRLITSGPSTAALPQADALALAKELNDARLLSRTHATAALSALLSPPLNALAISAHVEDALRYAAISDSVRGKTTAHAIRAAWLAFSPDLAARDDAVSAFRAADQPGHRALLGLSQIVDIASGGLQAQLPAGATAEAQLLARALALR